MITAKRVVLSLLLLAWLGLGLYAGRHLAGGLFLLMHNHNQHLSQLSFKRLDQVPVKLRYMFS